MNLNGKFGLTQMNGSDPYFTCTGAEFLNQTEKLDLKLKINKSAANRKTNDTVYTLADKRLVCVGLAEPIWTCGIRRPCGPGR